MGNEARIKLARFLLQRGELDLAERYEFLSLLVATLEEERRWTKYAKKAGGERAPETVLGHLVHKFFIGAEMIALEKQYGGAEAVALNTSKLYLAFVLYGPGVALHGDVAFADRTMGDLNRERVEFEKMIAIFPAGAHNYLKQAFDISVERDSVILSGKTLGDVSINGRFLWAVVVLSFLSKSLFEVRHGNVAFANTFHNMRDDVEQLERTFYSFRQLIRPQMDEIKRLMEKYPRWEEK